MPWVRIDDALPDHPKILKAGIEGAWLHVCGLAYCSRYLTNGVVPDEAVGGLLRGQKSPAACNRLAIRLVEAGLWKRCEGGFEIHDYLSYNPSKADIEAKREATRERVSRSRKRRGNALQDAPVTALPIPGVHPQQQQHENVPQRPDPDQSGPDPGAAAADQAKDPEVTAKLAGNLTAAGVDGRTAASLAEQFPERIPQQIAWLSLRNPSKNRAGLLVQSIREDWPRPTGQTSPSSHLPWVGRAADAPS